MNSVFATAAAKDLPSSGCSFIELQPTIQHYEWGDPKFIPQLRGTPNPEQRPCAELWIGAHPDGSALGLLDPEPIPLSDIIGTAPREILGPLVSAEFGNELPFLLKVLAAANPLSLQTHPSREMAEEGFAREDSAGIPRNAAIRNYKDKNHKPEMIVALTDFYALRGFRPLPQIARQVSLVPELGEVALRFRPTPEGLRALFSNLMVLPQWKINLLLGFLLARLDRLDSEKPFSREEPEYWILRANRIYSKQGQYDRGLFSFYLLNLIKLSPGEALFLPAGILHAYLEGAGVEIMATSNNVLRGGLTSKHIDVPELLQNVQFLGEEPEILRPTNTSPRQRWTYRTPAKEFELSRIDLDGNCAYAGSSEGSPEVILIESNSSGQPIEVTTDNGIRLLERGQVFMIPANKPFAVRAAGKARLFSARVPQPSPPGTAELRPLLFRGRSVPPLAFGTSGLRGLVKDITDLETYINTRGFLDYLLSIGDVLPGGKVSIACDLRPSSDGAERSIARAVARGIIDSGCTVENLGPIPTPALTLHGIAHQRPSIMVTGSHIPFDRNGIKFNRSTGEILKSDEPGILSCVDRVRQVEYRKEPEISMFHDNGLFHSAAARELPPVSLSARQGYMRRYLDFFPPNCLAGLRLLFYQHSAVGRDLLPQLLSQLGAEVMCVGRSEIFVPIDTEALSDQTLASLQEMVDQARAQFGSIDAVVSTDGDSDRPLLCGIDSAGRVQFISGDILGIIVARFLRAQIVVVPISSNDAVDRCAKANGTTVIKTRIGSPYVIEAMARAASSGAGPVVGWEANGGFLMATDVEIDGHVMTRLPTRDSVLPILAALCSARAHGISLSERIAQLPARFGKAGLLDNIAPQKAQHLLHSFRPEDPEIIEVHFRELSIRVNFSDGHSETASGPLLQALEEKRKAVEAWLTAQNGFDSLKTINTLDGVRLFFRNGDIIHLRPSGNAPQLRVYAVAGDKARAEAIVNMALAQNGGMLDLLADMEKKSAAKAFCASIRTNIALNADLLVRGEAPEIIGTVSGSVAAQNFWQEILNEARPAFKARAALSFHEDLPTNQAFGILLLWQRLKPHLREDRGALVAFVFGDGTRSTPFTETDNAQKPAIATFARDSKGPDSRFLTMVELAMRHFVPVQQYLRRSGFNGLVVKWGDEVQIPTRDLSGIDPLFRDADVVRFVSIREMNDDEARNKDWVGVNDAGHVTAFIPRRPLAEMQALAELGLVQRRGEKLYGGINLGSIALSSVLLDCLLEEFSTEVNDATANRKDRPALDPEFFTALTIAAMESPNQAFAAWQRAIRESADVANFAKKFPNALERLREVIRKVESRSQRKFKMVALDFGDQYWGDIGQHAKIREFYMSLNDPGPIGEVARALAGLDTTRDANGNLIVDSFVSDEITVRNSVLLGARLTGAGKIENAVLVGTRALHAHVVDGFDVLSTVGQLRIEPGAGAYKVVSPETIHARSDEHLTTLFLPDIGPSLFRVQQSTDLRQKSTTYAVPILNNPVSFQQAHDQMGRLSVNELRKIRGAAERGVLISNELRVRTVQSDQ